MTRQASSPDNGSPALFLVWPTTTTLVPLGVLAYACIEIPRDLHRMERLEHGYLGKKGTRVGHNLFAADS